jgi:hypothetical protein
MATATLKSDLASTNPNPRLRVGVLVDSLTMPQWASHILQQMEKSQAAELAVIVANDGDRVLPATHEGRGGPMPLLLRFWLEVDRRLFAGRSANPDINKPVLFTPANGCLIARNLGNLASRDRILAELRSMQLDLLLNLTSSELKRDLREVAKHGVWWFPDDNALLKELFWVLNNNAFIQGTVNIASRGRGTTTLPGCYSPADKYSFLRNFGVASEKKSTLLQRYLAAIQCQGQLPASAIPVISAVPVPGNLDTARLIFRMLGRMLQEQWTRRLRREYWFIGYRKVQSLESRTVGDGDFTLLRPPTGHSYADPFVIDKDGRTYIFFEDYCRTPKKGVIAFVVINSDGTCSLPEVALEEEYHLSYPCLLQFDGEIYLLPETKNQRTIQLYRATEFPRRWELSHVLLDNVLAVDSTLLRHDGRFWLFTCGLNSRDPWFTADSELFLFSASSLGGPWRAHPKNPIVADVRHCRSAGLIMRWGNQLIRPSQDCSTIYGSAVVFSQIEVLSENDYRETPIARISPDWLAHNRGTHTFNCSCEYEVWDGRTLVRRFWQPGSEAAFESATLLKPLVTRI